MEEKIEKSKTQQEQSKGPTEKRQVLKSVKEKIDNKEKSTARTERKSKKVRDKRHLVNVANLQRACTMAKKWYKINRKIGAS